MRDKKAMRLMEKSNNRKSPSLSVVTLNVNGLNFPAKAKIGRNNKNT